MNLPFFARIIVLMAAYLLIYGELFAQPGLPSNPSQTPIDGGLGLLALGGGAYAWRKLKEKNA